jgi:uncharacterized protein (UPF0335 family)
LTAKHANRTGITGIASPSTLTAAGGKGIAMVARRCAPTCQLKGICSMTVHITKAGVAGQELKQFIERVERLEEEKKAISGDIREVFAEMKGRGFDVRAVREIIKMRKQDHSQRKEMEAILELYMSALNMS